MSANLTKRDIVLSVHRKLADAPGEDNERCPQRTVRDVVQLTLNAIVDALTEGRTVELRNFGVFEVQVRESRVGRNPNEPDKDVVIPRRAVVRFKVGKELKARLADLDLDRL